ncbi:MAG: hypothetical protein QME59_05440 [Candidatus Hydrothermarchaeota archaeon]|nr:hypothetical protein [Candidatus Hydrothermarchaeota archaeon]
MRTLEKVARSIVKVLNELKIDYAIVGGIAVASWGNIRTTRDVDVIMALEEKKIRKLVNALKTENFSISEKDVRDSLKEKTHFTIFDKLSEYRIDAKGAYGEKEIRTLKTKKSVYFGELKGYVASPEDTIANKLAFGSEQDIKDAEGIYVRRMKKLDMRYLEKICRETGVYDDFLEMKKRVKKHLRELKK